MKLRIEDQNLRFKINEEELGILLNNHCISTNVKLPGQKIFIVINPQGSGNGMNVKMNLTNNKFILQLVIGSKAVQELSTMGRSRSGLCREIDGFSVSLQVDLRADLRCISN